eukprot:9481340-Pyramimonas_sp.AAC.1
MTETFNRECGFAENASKRQLWSAAGDPPAVVGHFGIQARPTDAEYHILCRHGWAYRPRS